ncbi:hypothetical protein OUZ56_026457 [Daphnia magna]|uniref:Uncharacterized protein n=1 Tax=Daphnia magna TaxID=35525 RepID=A0ABQ9ZLS9_9CRUS|nr:hypothetical protein OUZ56_026457 [Daphnia magna]
MTSFIRTPEMSSMNHYKDSIHILFKMKATGGLTVGTAAKISQPKLPLDNLMLVKTIETYLAKKTEMKIRKKNAEEDLKKTSVKDPKRKREFLKEGHGGTAKKRLVYDDVLPTQSILQHHVESEEESVDESVNESGNGSDESGEERNAHPFLENEEGLFLEAETECWPSEPGRLFTVLEQIGALTVLQTTAKPHITELKQRLSDLEAKNGFLFHQIDEKDLEISSLKAEVIELKNKQPDNLA